VRVVLDTNIFVPGLLSAAGPPARIIQVVLQRRLIPVMSLETFAELPEPSPYDCLNLRGAYKPDQVEPVEREVDVQVLYHHEGSLLAILSDHNKQDVVT